MPPHNLLKTPLWNGLHEYSVDGTIVDAETYDRHLVVAEPDSDAAKAIRERYWEPVNQMLKYLKGAHERGDVIKVNVPKGHPIPRYPAQFVVDVTPRAVALLPIAPPE